MFFALADSKVSQALIKKSPEIIKECENNPIFQEKCLKVTWAPNFSFTYVIHMVSPQKPLKITENMFEVLKFADKELNCGSLAMPAIGTGKYIS